MKKKIRIPVHDLMQLPLKHLRWLEAKAEQHRVGHLDSWSKLVEEIRSEIAIRELIEHCKKLKPL